MEGEKFAAAKGALLVKLEGVRGRGRGQELVNVQRGKLARKLPTFAQ